jgi:hypothetical protein
MFVRSASKVIFLLAASAGTIQADHVSFQDVSDRLGLFEYGPTAFNNRPPTDSSIAGMAWFDYDNDGDLDLFICTGSTKSNALFQNDGNGGFTDVTAEAGLTSMAACISIVAVDLDNDGHIDLFLGPELTVASGLILYKNNGDGTFLDVSSSSGLVTTSGHFGASAADYDGDGLVDIFITSSPGAVDHLFKNNGGFTFTDVSAQSGIQGPLLACGSIFADFTGDMLPDIVLGVCVGANPQATLLYTNNGDGTFTSSEISTLIFGMVRYFIEHTTWFYLYIYPSISHLLSCLHN